MTPRQRSICHQHVRNTMVKHGVSLEEAALDVAARSGRRPRDVRAAFLAVEHQPERRTRRFREAAA